MVERALSSSDSGTYAVQLKPSSIQYPGSEPGFFAIQWFVKHETVGFHYGTRVYHSMELEQDGNFMDRE